MTRCSGKLAGGFDLGDDRLLPGFETGVAKFVELLELGGFGCGDGDWLGKVFPGVLEDTLGHGGWGGLIVGRVLGFLAGEVEELPGASGLVVGLSLSTELRHFRLGG